MSSLLSDLIRRAFPSTNPGFRAVMLGLNDSGKTTLLYRMKLAGQVIQTIPSIGFNVEDVVLQTGRLGIPLKLTCWDIGGCGHSHLLGLFAQQADISDAIIWLIDSASDEAWFKESLDEFAQILRHPNYSTQQQPILVIATKQDLPNRRSIDTIRQSIAPVLKNRHWFAVDVTLETSLLDGPLVRAFGWLQGALGARKIQQEQNEPPPPSPSKTPSALETWLIRADSDSPDDVFLRQFENLLLPSWDHYTHIRLAFVLLEKHGRQKGKDLLFSGIQDYITRAPRSQTNGRTFHVTMTYLWIQLVHFGMQSTPPSDKPGAFLRFLLVNPYVVDGGLWRDYYSKDIMMSPQAKEGMVLPDLKPLPSLVVRDAIKSVR
ncbi:ADP-ribosylation factor [Mycena indigotica]|uniref:ADP-ribosylation factor n=1 Tax=Mycena indigotica TaxID=2126181 RepID=A0A8H6W3K6_9AGAR|nr:ADP-ribosylation factor [Mycena indigotica]KAF7303692.1 ADP-ribosylation factor [Mycena indigotica]